MGTDASLSKEENNSLMFMTSLKNSPDRHPDAIACRLHLSAVMIDAPLQLAWDISVEMGGYLRRLEHTHRTGS